MENQTRFNLNAAIEKWRQELAAQPNFAADERRELETHLGDAIADFRQRGLNDEESFWLARRRVGHPQELVQEFVKANPAKLYRERVFWLVFGLLIYRLWDLLASSLIGAVGMRAALPGTSLGHWLPNWVSCYVPMGLCSENYLIFLSWVLYIVNSLLVLAVLICVVRGQFEKLRPIVAFLFHSRLRFVIIAMLSIFVVSVASCLILNFNSLSFEMLRGRFLAVYLYSAFRDSSIIAVIAWLMPSQNRSASQLA
ncbi:MAG TPA: permease prefix domain 1-containing protein [Candidatus Acidoferrum sp.]|nr:permease prefix domain 1-containing protein [Candidatus Acidoferrum sp.]